MKNFNIKGLDFNISILRIAIQREKQNIKNSEIYLLDLQHRLKQKLNKRNYLKRKDNNEQTK